MTAAQKPVGIFTSIKFSKDFLIDHFDQFKFLAKPLIIPLFILNVIIFGSGTTSFMDTSFMAVVVSTIAYIIQLFYSSLFSIGWQRSIIFKPTADVEAKAGHLSPSEKSYIMMVYAYIAMIALATFIIGLLGMIPVLGILVILAGLPFLILIAHRLLIYFPAKAAGAGMTFRQAYDIGAGFGWRLLFAFILAIIPVYIAMIVATFVAQLIGSLFVGMAPESFLLRSIQGIFVAPVMVFFGLIFNAVFSGIMARYYLWAVQERAR